MKIGITILQEEIDKLFEDNVVKVYAKEIDSKVLRYCPKDWSVTLADNGSDIRKLMIEKWMNTKKFPQFSSKLNRKLNSVYLAHNKLTNECFLLYVFICRNEVRIFVGNSPYIGPTDNEKILKFLEPIYSIHDGFFLLDGGIIHVCGRQEVLEEISEAGVDGFIKIFQCNVDWLGLGLDNNDIKPYIIWGSDEEVEELDDLYEELDDWLATRISDYDDYE